MENHHAINGKINDISMAMFKSYFNLPEGNKEYTVSGYNGDMSLEWWELDSGNHPHSRLYDKSYFRVN